MFSVPDPHGSIIATSKSAILDVPRQHEALNSFTSERRVIQRQSGQSPYTTARLHGEWFSMAGGHTEIRWSQPVTRRDN
jgi:hypothetical protein